MDRTKQRHLKRWQILILTCFTSLFLGALYTWSVFEAPLCEKLGKENLSIVFTVANSIGPITMIPGGYINDRFGSKKVIFVGGLLYGFGLVFAGISRSVWQLALSFGLGVGLSMGMVYGCLIGNTVKLFPDRKGMAGGIITATFGMGAVVLPPIAQLLTMRFGIEVSFQIIGMISMLVVCSSAFVIGINPDISLCQEGVASTGNELTKDKNWKQMLKSPIFYVMLLILTSGATFGLMIISSSSAIAHNMMGLSVTTSALVVSILSLFNTGGRLLSGIVSDCLGRIETLRGVLFLALAALFFLYISEDRGLIYFYIGICLIGLCFGSFMGIFPGFTAEQFGSKYNTVNYGFMWIGFSVAGIIGPMISSKAFEITGGYGKAFFVAACIAECGLIMTYVYSIYEQNGQKTKNSKQMVVKRYEKK